MIRQSIALILSFAALVASPWVWAQGYEVRPWPDRQPVPVLAGSDLQGKVWRLADLRGKAVLINFWASWCAPCLAEMPSLQSLAQFYGPEKLVVLAVNFEESASVVRQHVRRTHFDLPVLLDPTGVMAHQWGAHVFPTTVLVAANGQVRGLVRGEVDWSGLQAAKLIEPLLAPAAKKAAGARRDNLRGDDGPARTRQGRCGVPSPMPTAPVSFYFSGALLMTTVHTQARRAFMKNMALAAVSTTLPAINFAQGAPTAERQFAPQAGTWRSFEVTTRVDILQPQGVTRVWLPIPSVNTDWQQSLDNAFSSNGKTQMRSDGRYGARMLYAEFAADEAKPFVELTSHIQTQNRSVDWTGKQAAAEDPTALKYWTQATRLLPTDGIVRQTALQAIRGARTDVEKAQKLYDWIVVNTFREPKVRGCGEGDIQTMLETGNLSGKCADLNALFVGLCRSVGLPARDVYGVRLAPSAFGYKQLGANPASLQGAQHCRAEVYLKHHGWVAMDPADVTKVMRLETSEWIKSPSNALVAPINKALFGSWEGNWMAYNMAHDVKLPHATGSELGFLMYPMAENASGRLNSYAPDDFKYQISAREIKA